MKTIIFITSLLTFLCTSMLAQEKSCKAHFSSRTEVRIDSKSALNEYYVADISALNFLNAEDAVAYFESKTDNLLSYQVDFNKKEVVIHFHLSNAIPSWKLKDWQNYITIKFN